jgi:hypothetical protein
VGSGGGIWFRGSKQLQPAQAAQRIDLQGEGQGSRAAISMGIDPMVDD